MDRLKIRIVFVWQDSKGKSVASYLVKRGGELVGSI